MAEVQVRDGSHVEDARLGRLKSFSPKSRRFALAERLEAEQLDTLRPRSYTWYPHFTLDQDGTGGCVSWTLEYDDGAPPKAWPNPNDQHALERYWRIQDRDEWPGSARPGDSPQYDGTSVRAGADQMIAEGRYERYDWADFDNAARAVAQIKLAVGYRGPVPMGINWHAGMMRRDPDGFIHPTGRVVGGHSILIVGVSLRLNAVKLKQSWGAGSEDFWLLSFTDLERLMDEDGEAYSPTRRPVTR